MNKNQLVKDILDRIDTDIQEFPEAIFYSTEVYYPLSKLTVEDIKKIANEIKQKYISALINLVEDANYTLKENE